MKSSLLRALALGLCVSVPQIAMARQEGAPADKAAKTEKTEKSHKEHKGAAPAGTTGSTATEKSTEKAPAGGGDATTSKKAHRSKKSAAEKSDSVAKPAPAPTTP
jgi:hypothetical protein